MTRTARAILIAGDEIGAPGTSAAGAASALDIVMADLLERFTCDDIVRLQPTPTVQLVRDAFAAMNERLQRGELFIVMFAGHGAKPTCSVPAQSWVLSDRERFDDIELADRLLALPPHVDAVVISDCCYGEGFFNAGEGVRFETLMRAMHDTARGVPLAGAMQAVQREQLETQSSALGLVLRREFKRARRSSPMVCISAASKDKEVATDDLPDLVRKTVAAARERQSYADLEDVFERSAAVGSVYHVDARPIGRICDVVLRT